ncbi:MAG: hypothetical protein ACNA8P_01040, partial [Phycisphaerales bacterium]
ELDGVEAHLTTKRGDTPKLRAILGATRGITDPEWDAAVPGWSSAACCTRADDRTGSQTDDEARLVRAFFLRIPPIDQAGGFRDSPGVVLGGIVW